jgi:hypothetical protein
MKRFAKLWLPIEEMMSCIDIGGHKVEISSYIRQKNSNALTKRPSKTDQ